MDVAADVGWKDGRNSRGIALADFDNDGDLDVLVTHQFDSVSLYRNDSAPKSWLGLDLTGDSKACSRDAVGTRVWLHFPSESAMAGQYREVTSANGFSAQGDRRILFGLGHYNGAVTVEVQWCGMARERLTDLTINRYHRITQHSR